MRMKDHYNKKNNIKVILYYYISYLINNLMKKKLNKIFNII